MPADAAGAAVDRAAAAGARSGHGGGRRFIVLIGAPGAGKGTQAERLAEALGLCKLSTGELLRDAVRTGSELGRAAEERMRQGGLVEDEVILGLVREELGSPRCSRGAVLDGFPRNLAQAEGLERLLAEAGERLERVLAIEVADEEIVRRLSGRRMCERCGRVPAHGLGQAAAAGRAVAGAGAAGDGACERCGGSLVQRPDDRPETVRRRLEVYRRETAPLVEGYAERGLLARVDGGGDVARIQERVRKELA